MPASPRVAILVVALLSAYVSFAYGRFLREGSFIPVGETVRPPPGFLSFCVREPTQCAAGPAAGPVRLDPQTWELLSRVDADVNAHTRRLDDRTNHGVPEYWAIVRNGHGDCNDIAVTKRSILHHAGIPLRDLRLALVATDSGDRHVVLTVVTERGDLVLDSLSSEIRPWNDTPYRWLMRQDGSAIGWAAIAN